MKITKTLLLASASVMVLGFGATTAQAFDDVDWEWNKVVTSTENITINVNDTFDISGLVEIEKIQMNIGDVTATSIVNGITNNAPGEGGSEGGTVLIDETFTFVTTTNDDVDPSVVLPVGPTAGNGEGPLSGELLGDTLDEGSDQLVLTFRAFGEVEVPQSEISVKDAVDLPEVNSVATAVGNNQSIESTVAVNLHDAQYNFGGFDSIFGDRDDNVVALDAEVAVDEDDSEFGTGNTHTDILIAGVLGGLLGVVEPGQVTALSQVSAITDASVNSEATAVGNNLSVDIAAATPGDAFLIADLTQFNYADVSATSKVGNVSVNGYANLDVLEGPLVNSVATAVGNNVSISVSSPVADSGE